MTLKQKKVADYIVGYIKNSYSIDNCYLHQQMKKSQDLDLLFDAMYITDGELVFAAADYAGYSISTLNEINNAGTAGYRIYDAVKDYIWDEWLKIRNND